MAAKRCPMCHRLSSDSARACACGYTFGQHVEQALELLRGQLRTTRARLALAVLVDLAMIGLVIPFMFIGWLPLIGLAFSGLATARALRQLRITRESMHALAPIGLPAARLVDRTPTT